MAHRAVKRFSSPRAPCALLFAAALLGACAVAPPVREVIEPVPPPPAPIIVVSRAPADVERINELETQISSLQRQLADKQKQLADRQKQAGEEKQRLELLIKEQQQRANDLQGKLDAILAIDRELRRGGRSVE